MGLVAHLRHPEVRVVCLLWLQTKDNLSEPVSLRWHCAHRLTQDAFKKRVSCRSSWRDDRNEKKYAHLGIRSLTLYAS